MPTLLHPGSKLSAVLVQGDNRRKLIHSGRMRLKVKLALFNLLSKLAVAALLLLFIPPVTERLNLRQIDNELVGKREKLYP